MDTESDTGTTRCTLLALPWKCDTEMAHGSSSVDSKSNCGTFECETELDPAEDSYLINRKIKHRLPPYRKILLSNKVVTPDKSFSTSQSQLGLKRSFSVPPSLGSSAESERATMPIRRQLSDVTELFGTRALSEKICTGHYSADLDLSETQEERTPVIWFFFRCVFWIAFVFSIILFLHQEFSPRCATDPFLPDLSFTTFKTVIGQDRALREIIRVWKIYSDSNGTNPLVLLLWGPSGVGKTMVSNMVASQFSVVHYVHLPLLPSEDTSNLPLQSLIASRLSTCGPHLFIFDAVDEGNDLLLSFWQLLDKWSDMSPYPARRTVFIFVATAHNQYVTECVINSTLVGERGDFCNTGHTAASLPRVAGFRFWDQVNRENFHVIPFLPLTRDHVKLCIQNELVGKGIVPVEHLVESIANQMTYIPKHTPVLSKEGCKLVFVKVNLALEYDL